MACQKAQYSRATAQNITEVHLLKFEENSWFNI